MKKLLVLMLCCANLLFFLSYAPLKCTQLIVYLDAYHLGDRLLKAAIEKSGSSNLCENVNDDVAYLADFSLQDYQIKHIPAIGYMFLDSVDDVIKSFLRTGYGWEEGDIAPRILSSIKPGTIAIDIGAHVGTHTIRMSRVVGPNGLVIAFEPQGKIFRELYFNLALNGCSNVIPVKCALDSKRTRMVIRQDVPGNEGASYLMPDGPGENVVAVCLDDFNLNNISCIKIDTENMEEDVLRGAINTIKRCNPIIIIEIQGNDVRAARNAEDSKARAKLVFELLESLGYKVDLIACCEYVAHPRS